MRPRTALIAVVALALAAPVPASAATKKKKPAPLPKSCNLYTDEAGDGQWGGQKSTALDVLAADMATGPTQFVATVKLASVDYKSDPLHFLGYEWAFQATSSGVKYNVTASVTGTSGYSTTATVGGVSVPHTFEVVAATNTLVWRFKRADAKAMARPGLVWTDFTANSDAFGGSADKSDAVSKKRYIDKQPSCVVAK